MATTYYDRDTDISRIQGRKVAIIGYGSQGHAHALNLRDSGVKVRVGLHSGSASRAKAVAEGLEVDSVAVAARWADVVMILVPDTIQSKLYQTEIQPNLEAGNTLMFAHGFNIRFGTIQAPSGVDVSLVAPKAPGHRVRETYLSGEGTPGLMAVEVNSSGGAREDALSYASALGCTRAGVIETTFREETETDLFGEQAVLCGGVSELVKAGFETLVEAGYQPEIAYFECLHELKLIVDLMYRGGLNYMRYSVSDTAEYGDYVAGPQIVDEHVRSRMKELLARIQDGSFARQWVAEWDQGGKNFHGQRRANQAHLIEEVGRRLRAGMQFLDPVEIEPEGTPAKAVAAEKN